MGKKKKRARFGARTIWMMIIGYLVLGVITALIYLSRNAPDPAYVDMSSQGMTNPWALFPVVVMLWPIFVVVLLFQIFF